MEPASWLAGRRLRPYRFMEVCGRRFEKTNSTLLSNSYGDLLK